MRNPITDTTPDQEVIRAIGDLKVIGDELNTLQETLLSTLARRLDETFGSLPDGEEADALGQAATLGAASVLTVLSLVAEGLIISDTTMDSLSPVDRLSVLSNSIAHIESESPEEVDEEDDEGVSIGDVIAPFANVFGESEETQIGADSR